MKLTQMKQEGFTLIEILMVVLVIGILATIGITQFVNFGGDTKTATLKSNLAIMRNAIASKNGLERIRCAKTASTFPLGETLISNDITYTAGLSGTGGPCTYGVLRDPASGTVYATKTAINASYITLGDAAYFAGPIPNNPWSTSGSTDTQQRTVSLWTATPGIRAAVGKNCVNANFAATVPAAITASEYGWCYDATNGQIWANSAANDGLNTGTGTESQL